MNLSKTDVAKGGSTKPAVPVKNAIPAEAAAREALTPEQLQALQAQMPVQVQITENGEIIWPEAPKELAELSDKSPKIQKATGQGVSDGLQGQAADAAVSAKVQAVEVEAAQISTGVKVGAGALALVGLGLGAAGGGGGGGGDTPSEPPVQNPAATAVPTTANTQSAAVTASAAEKAAAEKAAAEKAAAEKAAAEKAAADKAAADKAAADKAAADKAAADKAAAEKAAADKAAAEKAAADKAAAEKAAADKAAAEKAAAEKAAAEKAAAEKAAAEKAAAEKAAAEKAAAEKAAAEKAAAEKAAADKAAADKAAAEKAAEVKAQETNANASAGKTATAPAKVAVTLNPITADDTVDASEKQGKVMISGKLSGNPVAGADVAVYINGSIYRTKTLADHSFEVAVEGRDLTENSKGNLIDVIATGKDAGGAAFRAGVRDAYKVAAQAAADIDITGIGNGSVQGMGDAAPLVRISGVVDTGNTLFALGQNDTRILGIAVTIGGETFRSGINNKDNSFFIDVPADVMHYAEGETIRYEFYTDASIYALEKKGEYEQSISLVDAAQHSDGLKATFSGEAVMKAANGSYTVGAIDKDTAMIVSGKVSGTAKAGDTVTLEVGGQTFETTVRADKTFSAAVSNQAMLEDADQAVTATLSTTDKSGIAVNVKDVEAYARPNTQQSDANVSKNPVVAAEQAKADAPNIVTYKAELPYFINAITERYTTNNNLNSSGLLRNVPVGGKGTEKAVVKYHFVTEAELAKMTQNHFRYSDYKSMTTYSEQHKAYIRSAYKIISKYINVEFVEVDSREQSDTDFYIGNFTNGQERANAFAYTGGDVYWNNSNDFWSKGNDEVHYVGLHEILHTLGAEDTVITSRNDKDGKDANWSFKRNAGTYLEDSTEFTNMSYNRTGELSQHDLRLFDLAFLHFRWGVNTAERAGNDVYTFKNYDASVSDGGIYIWDGAGIDTFDASAEKQGVYVNLTPGSWIYSGGQAQYFAAESGTPYNRHSYFGMASNIGMTGTNVNEQVLNYTKGQAFIGYGTQIENLNGSAHNDVLIGNDADNNISGGAGNDDIQGGAGNDWLDGGAGADKLAGGKGNDVYTVDNAADSITEQAGEGSDHVYSSVDHTLGAHLEKLTLIGSTAVTAAGNAEANTLQGNGLNNVINGLAGNDRIIGGRGSDTLTGGAGKDTFVFDSILDGSADTITDFTVGEDLIELSKGIFSAVSNTITEWENYVQYHADTGHLTYDADGKGAGAAVHFATLDTDLNIQQNSFVVV